MERRARTRHLQAALRSGSSCRIDMRTHVAANRCSSELDRATFEAQRVTALCMTPASLPIYVAARLFLVTQTSFVFGAPERYVSKLQAGRRSVRKLFPIFEEGTIGLRRSVGDGRRVNCQPCLSSSGCKNPRFISLTIHRPVSFAFFTDANLVTRKTTNSLRCSPICFPSLIVIG